MNLHLLDSSEQLLAVIPLSASIHAGGDYLPVFEATHHQIVRTEDTFTLVAAGDHMQSTYLQEGNKIAYQDAAQDNRWYVFEIMKVSARHENDATITVYAENVYYDLLYDLIEDKKPRDVKANEMLENLLEDTLWNVGTMEPELIEQINANFYYENAMTCIRRVEDLYQVELDFRLSYDPVNRRFDRFIDIVKELGTYKGKAFTYAKDLTHIERTMDLSHVYTALYGRGSTHDAIDGGGNQNRIDFSDVEWKLANGDPVDKPLGQAWVGSTVSMQQFGRQGGTVHRKNFYLNENQTDPTLLLNETWNHLQTINKPLVTYQVGVIDLYRYTDSSEAYSHEAVDLGDYVWAIDQSFYVPFKEQVRVVEMKKDLIYPEETELVLGNFLDDGLSTTFSSSSSSGSSTSRPNAGAPSRERLDAFIDIAGSLPFGTTLHAFQNHGAGVIPFQIYGNDTPSTSTDYSKYSALFIIPSTFEAIAKRMVYELERVGLKAVYIFQEFIHAYPQSYLESFNVTIYPSRVEADIVRWETRGPKIIHDHWNWYHVGKTSGYYESKKSYPQAYIEIPSSHPYYFSIFDGLTSPFNLGGVGMILQPTTTVDPYNKYLPIAKYKETGSPTSPNAFVWLEDNLQLNSPLAFFGVTGQVNQLSEDGWKFYIQFIREVIVNYKPDATVVLRHASINVNEYPTMHVEALEPWTSALRPGLNAEVNVNTFGTQTTQAIIPNIQTFDTPAGRRDILLVNGTDAPSYKNRLFLQEILADTGYVYQSMNEDQFAHLPTSIIDRYKLIIFNSSNESYTTKYVFKQAVIYNNNDIGTFGRFPPRHLLAWSTGNAIIDKIYPRDPTHIVFNHPSLSSPGQSNYTLYASKTSVQDVGLLEGAIGLASAFSHTEEWTMAYHPKHLVGYYSVPTHALTDDGRILYQAFIDYMLHLTTEEALSMEATPTAQTEALIPSVSAEVVTKPTEKEMNVLIVHGSQATQANLIKERITQMGYATDLRTDTAMKSVGAAFFDPFTHVILLGTVPNMLGRLQTDVLNPIVFTFDYVLASNSVLNIGQAVRTGGASDLDLIPSEPGHPIYQFTTDPQATSYQAITGIDTAGRLAGLGAYAQNNPGRVPAAHIINALWPHLNDAAIGWNTITKAMTLGCLQIDQLTDEAWKIVQGMLVFSQETFHN